MTQFGQFHAPCMVGYSYWCHNSVVHALWKSWTFVYCMIGLKKKGGSGDMLRYHCRAPD